MMLLGLAPSRSLRDFRLLARASFPVCASAPRVRLRSFACAERPRDSGHTPAPGRAQENQKESGAQDGQVPDDSAGDSGRLGVDERATSGAKPAAEGTEKDFDAKHGPGDDKEQHHRTVSPSEALGALTLPYRHTMRLFNLTTLGMGFQGAWTSYPDFREGAIQAVETVYGLAAAEDFLSLRGLVGEALLEELQKDAAETLGMIVALRAANPLGIWTAKPREDSSGENFLRVVMAFDISEEYRLKDDGNVHVVQRLNWVTFERSLGKNSGQTGAWQIVAIEKLRSRPPFSPPQ